jgi:hypothetical protein
VDNFQWILNYDGDSAGRQVGRAILSNDPEKLREVSERINLGHEIVKKWAQDHNGGIISGGGDEGCFHLPHEALDHIEQLRADYHFATNLTMSVGVGKTLSEAGKSLIAAKFRGKNQVVIYDPRIEQELQQVQLKLEDGTANEVEKKQGDAYLRPEGQDTVMDGKDKSITKAEDHVKGVHTPMSVAGGQGDKKRYGSDAGYHAAHAKKGLAGRTGAGQEKGWAVQAHKKVIAESRAMPKPNLTKDEEIANEENPPMNEMISSEPEHDCPYCQELGSQGIEDETCPYCAQHDPASEGHPDDCPYCAVMNHDPGADGHGDDCPYCNEMANHDPSMDGHEADCPYCQLSSQDIGGDDQSISPNDPSTELLPTTQDSQNYAGQDFARPGMDKPAAISSQPSKTSPLTDSKTNQNIILENSQGGPAAQEYQDPLAAPVGTTSTPENSDSVESITNEIDALGADQVPLRAEGQNDDADLPNGSNMEGNVSRPENYSQNSPTDMGLGEQPDDGTPDVTSVLQQGLDSHADSIKREKVVAMVGEALEGFKGCKMILERAKLEAPQLYTSSIAMLRAMIEMAKLLGLDQDQAAQPSGVVEESPNILSPEEGVLEGQPAGGMPEDMTNDPQAQTEAAGGHPDYNNLYPAHPDGGGADPKLQGR